MLPGTNAEYVKAYNQRIVLDTIRRRGPISRTEVADATALTVQTVSNIVQQLAEQGLVALGARRSGGRGQPPVEVELDPAGAFAVGLELDRDHLTAVLVDLAGTVHAHLDQALEDPTPEEALARMHRAVQELLPSGPSAAARLRGIGVALPGQITVGEDAVSIPTNFAGWDGVPVERELARRTGRAVYVDNDATAAAIGEAWHGDDEARRNMLYVYFGLGLGGGLILAGQPYRGHGLNAGKLGHVSVAPHGAACSCGGRGCLELYAGLGALAERLEGAGAVLRPDAVERLQHDGDPRVRAWLDDAAERLTFALLATENLLDPEAVVMGGRLPPRIAEELAARLNKSLPERRMRGKPFQPRLRVSELGPHAAALGAAVLPLYETLAPSHALLLKRPRRPRERGASM